MKDSIIMMMNELSERNKNISTEKHLLMGSFERTMMIEAMEDVAGAIGSLAVHVLRQRGEIGFKDLRK